MDVRIKTLIGEDFGFYGSYSGPEYDSFPAWKKAVADAILAKGMEYWITKCNFTTACEKNLQYVKAAQKILSGESDHMPLYLKFSDVEEWLLVFEMQKESIRMLIKIYTSEMG